MKLLLVIDTYRTNNNGTSISGQRFVEELRRKGHEVRILCADEMPEKMADNGLAYGDTYLLPERHIYGFDNLIHKHGFRFANSLSSQSRKTIRKAVEWADMIHCMMPFVLSRMAKNMADELGKPATAAFHIQPENMTSSVGLGKVAWITNAFYWFFNKLVYGQFTHVHTPSQFMADEIAKRGYTAKLFPISNGISHSFHYRRVEKTPELQGKIVITMTGRLSGEKRQDLLLRAVEKSQFGDRIQLVFAGKGPKYEEYRRMGERLANKPIFGYYNREQLQDLLGMTDLYVHASDMESEAIGCIEAFATGLVPIISDSRLSATRQFALDERSLFEAGNPQSLAERIDYWLQHPAEREAQALRYAEKAKEYHLAKSVAQFENMLLLKQMSYHPQAQTVQRPAFTFPQRVAAFRTMLSKVAMTVALLLVSLVSLAQQLPYSNLDQWVVREIEESGILGGNTRTIYSVGRRDTIRGNKQFSSKDYGSPWSTSNVWAKVTGISKASVSCFPEKRGNGYCARLENRLDGVTALGIINLKVLASGTLFTGVTCEPVSGKGAEDPYSVIDMGVPFTGHPTALVFDYKSLVEQSNTLTYAKATSRVQTRTGFDCPKVTVILQKRWEDEKGNVYATRIGTACMLIKTTQTNWQNATRLPIVYGDVSKSVAEDMKVGSYVCKTRNKQGKMVQVNEVGYANDTPTHIIIQFSAGCHEAFVGHAGNTLWVDNIRLEYE